jgi:hypothetical protein
MTTRNHRFPVGEGTPAVEIRNPTGSVAVEAPEGATEFVVDIEPLNNAAEQLLDDVEVGVLDSRLRIAVPERRLFRSPDFAVRVTVPAGTDAHLAAASADSVLRGPLGRVTLASASGDVTVESCTELRVRTASGDTRVGRVTESAAFASASAGLHLESVGGAVEVRTASGDVTVGRASGDIGVTTASGDVAVERVSSGSVRVKTMSGDVSVGVVPGQRVWLDLSSVSGRIESQLEDDDTSDGPAQVSVAVRSVSGDQRVRPVPVA